MKGETERRVYNLPADLLARVRAYQAAIAAPSEIAAVRRLLTDALDRRETLEQVIGRAADVITTGGTLREAAQSIGAHPLLQSFAFVGNSLRLKTVDGEEAELAENGCTRFGGWDA